MTKLMHKQFISKFDMEKYIISKSVLLKAQYKDVINNIYHIYYERGYLYV